MGANIYIIFGFCNTFVVTIKKAQTNNKRKIIGELDIMIDTLPK